MKEGTTPQRLRIRRTKNGVMTVFGKYGLRGGDGSSDVRDTEIHRIEKGELRKGSESDEQSMMG